MHGHSLYICAHIYVYALRRRIFCTRQTCVQHRSWGVPSRSRWSSLSGKWSSLLYKYKLSDRASGVPCISTSYQIGLNRHVSIPRSWNGIPSCKEHSQIETICDWLVIGVQGACVEIWDFAVVLFLVPSWWILCGDCGCNPTSGEQCKISWQFDCAYLILFLFSLFRVIHGEDCWFGLESSGGPSTTSLLQRASHCIDSQRSSEPRCIVLSQLLILISKASRITKVGLLQALSLVRT